MKSPALTAVPKGVVTLRWPEVAFVGTPVVTVVEVAAMTVASVALNRRRSFNRVVSKCVPVTVTAVPATPMVGVKLEIVGAPAVVTVNGCGLVADPLGVELARTLPPEPRPDLVLEVPLHPARRRERGYNQAGLLADALSLACGTPRLEGTLSRVRPTRPQARLDPGQRRENVSGAFRVRRPDCLRGRNVLIVDDVMTTGSTLEACLEVLSEVGARPTGVALAWAQ